MNSDERIRLKSFLYIISSNEIGYHVYKNEDNQNNALIAKLVCSTCNKIWETGDTECFFCGTKNYFVYTCENCQQYYSITGNSIKCPNCGQNLKKLCVNKNCPTNNSIDYPELFKRVRKKEVFKTSGPYSIRQNSCKNCGSRSNNYLFSKIKVVFDIDDLENEENEVRIFINFESKYTPVKKYHYYVNQNKMETKDGSLNEIKKMLDNITIQS